MEVYVYERKYGRHFQSPNGRGFLDKGCLTKLTPEIATLLAKWDYTAVSPELDDEVEEYLSSGCEEKECVVGIHPPKKGVVFMRTEYQPFGSEIYDPQPPLLIDGVVPKEIPEWLTEEEWIVEYFVTEEDQVDFWEIMKFCLEGYWRDLAETEDLRRWEWRYSGPPFVRL